MFSSDLFPALKIGFCADYHSSDPFCPVKKDRRPMSVTFSLTSFY